MHSEHFSESELSCHGVACCGGANEVKQELLDALEAFREVVGRPVVMDCAYRCHMHNSAVGGAPGSEHPDGIAADIKVSGMTALEMYRAALKVPAFANGGIGVAENQGYIHVDTRKDKARWCYSISGAWCAWDPAIDQRTA